MTTQMTPEDFRSAVDSALNGSTHHVDRSLATAVAGDVVAGRRLLRRRRLAAAGTVAAAVVAVGTLALTSQGEGSPEVAVPPSGVSDADRTALAGCAGAAVTDAARRALHSGGEPAIIAAESTALGTLGVLESGDGRHWAECYVWSDMSDGRRPAVVVYPVDGRGGWGYTPGAACEPVEGQVPVSCRRFALRWADRLPDEVAAVRFETSDGKTTEVPTVDGYVVLNYEGDLPDGIAFTPQGDTGRWSPLRQVTYVDAGGDPLAAEVFDRTGSGPERNRVAGLPPLDAQASRRGAPVM